MVDGAQPGFDFNQLAMSMRLGMGGGSGGDGGGEGQQNLIDYLLNTFAERFPAKAAYFTGIANLSQPEQAAIFKPIEPTVNLIDAKIPALIRTPGGTLARIFAILLKDGSITNQAEGVGGDHTGGNSGGDFGGGGGGDFAAAGGGVGGGNLMIISATDNGMIEPVAFFEGGSNFSPRNIPESMLGSLSPPDTPTTTRSQDMGIA